MITTIQLPRGPEWRRGEIVSTLLTFRAGCREQCCVGVACTQLGVPDEAILECPGLTHVMTLPEPLHGLLRFECRHFEPPPLQSLYEINDRVSLSDEDRVAQLNTVLEETGIPLRFELEEAC